MGGPGGGEFRADEIKERLSRILESPLFITSDRLGRFLRFVVESALAGQANQIKERRIGVEIYDRAVDYEPRLDPIVRVEAARLRSKLREYYETLGSADPIRVVIGKGSYVPSFQRRPQQSAPAPPTERASVAVLPFVNLGGAPADEHFSEGLTEELINLLASLPGLRVAARTSAFQFKNKAEDVRTIGHALNVAAILEGSIRRSGDQIRIAVQLIDATDGCYIWSTRYDRRLVDVLALQNELATSIAAALRVQLARRSTVDQSQLAVDTAAHEAYLQGRYYFNRLTIGDVTRSIPSFLQAIAREPRYAMAHAGLADAHCVLGLWGVSDDQHLAKSRDAAEAALAIDSRLAEARMPLGAVKAFHAWDWHGAEREFRLALDERPGSAHAHYLYAYFCLMPALRTAEAVNAARTAVSLDPLSPFMNMGLGRAYYVARSYDAAIDQFTRTLQLDPGFREAHWQLGLTFLQTRRFDRAIASFNHARSLDTGYSGADAALGYAYGLLGKSADARRLLRKSGSPAESALIHLGLGEHERALACLERAAVERHRLMMWIKADPRFEPLAEYPRYKALVQHVGLGG
jgi:serine/threonine-protein kinase